MNSLSIHPKSSPLSLKILAKNSSESDMLREDASSQKSAESPTSMQKKRKTSTFPFGKCKVCDDTSTGIHYGVSTCEGCKVKAKIKKTLCLFKFYFAKTNNSSKNV
jgi:hypothetical protein